MDITIAGIEDNELHRGPGGTECFLKRRCRDELRAPVGSLEEQAALANRVVGAAVTTEADHEVPLRLRTMLTSRSAESTEVHDRRLQLAQLADQVQRLHCPPRHD